MYGLELVRNKETNAAETIDLLSDWAGQVISLSETIDGRFFHTMLPKDREEAEAFYLELSNNYAGLQKSLYWLHNAMVTAAEAFRERERSQDGGRV